MSIQTLLKLAQLRWTCLVTRMPDERLPKKILYGELQIRKRSHGGQKKRYKDTLKASLKDLNIPTVVGTDFTGSNKVAWPHKKGCWRIRSKKTSAKPSRNVRSGKPELKHHQQLSSSYLSCAIRNRQFRAKIGLISCHRTNNNTSRI